MVHIKIMMSSTCVGVYMCACTCEREGEGGEREYGVITESV